MYTVRLGLMKLRDQTEGRDHNLGRCPGQMWGRHRGQGRVQEGTREARQQRKSTPRLWVPFGQWMDEVYRPIAPRWVLYPPRAPLVARWQLHSHLGPPWSCRGRGRSQGQPPHPWSLGLFPQDGPRPQGVSDWCWHTAGVRGAGLSPHPLLPRRHSGRLPVAPMEPSPTLEGKAAKLPAKVLDEGVVRTARHPACAYPQLSQASVQGIADPPFLQDCW